MNFEEGCMAKGFTLIELLIVVVIIGILATVAIPQYRVAMEKSRATEALTVGKALVEATNRAYTERPNEVPNTRTSLDVTPSGGSWTAADTYETLNSSYILHGEYIEIVTLIRDGSYTIKLYTDGSDTPGKKECVGQGDLGKEICNSLSTVLNPD